MRQEDILVCYENNLKGPTEGPVKAGSGCRCPGCDDTAAEDLSTRPSDSDAWEAFCITALDSYANELAPELALSVA